MADGNETATSPGGSATTQQTGSEFALPQGVNDDEIWTKHFGGEEKPKREKRESKEPSKPEARSSKGGDEKEPSSKPRSKPTEPPKKDGKSSKPSDESESEERTESKPKAEPKKEAKGKTEKAEADDEASTDSDKPEAAKVSARAKELYEEAKASKDPKESRKLYKRAMKEAFGEVPAEFDEARYGAVRRERQAAQAALDEKAAKNEGRIREAAEKLRPAIAVMQMLEKGGVAERLTVPLVEKAITVLRSLRSLEDGDFTGLADVVSKATGCDPDEAMKRFIRGTKVSPEGRASRAAAEEASRRAEAATARVQELERKLAERDESQTKEKTQAEKVRLVEQRRAQYLDDLNVDLEGHPVLKLPRGAERVMAYIIKTADKKLRAPKYTPEQAANRIVAYERKRARDASSVLDTDGEEVEPRTETRSSASIARSEQRDNGVVSSDPEAAFDRIYRKHNTGRR